MVVGAKHRDMGKKKRNRDVSHGRVSWEDVSKYNLNVYGAWRQNNKGTFYIDTEVIHFPYSPLPPPPMDHQQQVVFKLNGVLQTRPWSGVECDAKLGIRVDSFDVNHFRYSQYNKNAVGNWSALLDGSGGLFVDPMKRDCQFVGRVLVL